MAYVSIKVDNQEKCWAPHRVCYVCVEDLRKWSEKEKLFRFIVAMVRAVEHGVAVTLPEQSQSVDDVLQSIEPKSDKNQWVNDCKVLQKI